MQLTRKGFLQLALASLAPAGLGAGCSDDTGSGGAGGASGSTNSTGSGNNTTASVSSTGSGATSGTSSAGTGVTGSTSTGDMTTGGSTSSTGNSTSGATTGATGSSSSTGGMFTCDELISANHGHALEVTEADVMAGVDKTYDIQGVSGHTHSVTVTAADFADLALGNSVAMTSSVGSQHSHPITISCSN